MNSCTMKTPVGNLVLVTSGNKLTSCTFTENSGPAIIPIDNLILLQAIEELTKYFSGVKVEFKTPLYAQGTRFQNIVWKNLQSIKWGETITYGELAAETGTPKAARAVGNALGKNPLPIFIPCHRVLAAHSLGGYSSGIERKKFLLTLERAFSFS
ncbi:MAG: methylated-DNA--[protein]-cysteine S-methyltransferase [Leptospirales bacterium]